MREINELRHNPPEGIRIQTNEEDMLDVTGVIEGPGTWCFICSSPSGSSLARQVTKLGRVGCDCIPTAHLTDAFFVEGTPYAGGYFKVRFSFTEQFPNAPPKCEFYSLFLGDRD